MKIFAAEHKNVYPSTKNIKPEYFSKKLPVDVKINLPLI